METAEQLEREDCPALMKQSAFLTVVLIIFALTFGSAAHADDNNLYLYKVVTKIDGMPIHPTTLLHDERTNLFFDKKDIIVPESQVIINKFVSMTAVPNLASKKAWQHVFTIDFDRADFNTAVWEKNHRINVGCIVYRNKIIGLTFFGPKGKTNSLKLFIAAGKEGADYLKEIFMNIKANSRPQQGAELAHPSILLSSLLPRPPIKLLERTAPYRLPDLPSSRLRRSRSAPGVRTL